MKYKPCPFCGAEEGEPEDCGPLCLAIQDNTKLWTVDCLACGAEGPTHNTADGAESRWNERANNKP